MRQLAFRRDEVGLESQASVGAHVVDVARRRQGTPRADTAFAAGVPSAAGCGIAAALSATPTAWYHLQNNTNTCTNMTSVARQL